MIKRANLGVTEQPSDLPERDARISEITESHTLSQIVENVAEGCSLFREASRQRPLAHAKLACNHNGAGAPPGEKTYQLPFHNVSHSRCSTPSGEEMVGMRP